MRPCPPKIPHRLTHAWLRAWTQTIPTEAGANHPIHDVAFLKNWRFPFNIWTGLSSFPREHRVWHNCQLLTPVRKVIELLFAPQYSQRQVSWFWRGLYCVAVGRDRNTVVEQCSCRRLEHGSVNHAPLYRCAGCAGQNRLTSLSWRWNRLQIMQCDSISPCNSTERNKWMSYRTSCSADRGDDGQPSRPSLYEMW